MAGRAVGCLTALVAFALVTAGAPAAHGAPAKSPPPNTALVRLAIPKDASRASVRVKTEARDCSALPTVRVVVGYRVARPGRAVLRISDLDGVVATRPRAVVRGNRLVFRRAARRRGRVRLRAVVVPRWLKAKDGQKSCYLLLPALVSPGSPGSDASRGVQRLRTLATISEQTTPPRRTTVRDAVWRCPIAETDGLDCRVRVLLQTAGASAKSESATGSTGQRDNTSGAGDTDDDDGRMALLAALVAGGTLGGAALTKGRSRER